MVWKIDVEKVLALFSLVTELTKSLLWFWHQRRSDKPHS
jgi:hypothetical protein